MRQERQEWFKEQSSISLSLSLLDLWGGRDSRKKVTKEGDTQERKQVRKEGGNKENSLQERKRREKVGKAKTSRKKRKERKDTLKHGALNISEAWLCRSTLTLSLMDRWREEIKASAHCRWNRSYGSSSRYTGSPLHGTPSSRRLHTWHLLPSLAS